MDFGSWTFFAFAIPAVVFAGISKGGFGSGAAFAGASILALVLEPGQALGIMLPLLMLIDVASLPAYWKKWSWPDARLMIIGSIPGAALGAWLFSVADADVIRILIGAVSLAFVAYQLALGWRWFSMPNRRLPAWVGLLSGTAAGFTSFISHAGGPIAAVYLLSQKLTKTSYQATTVLVFWAMNAMKFFVYAWLGIFSLQTFTVDLFLAPFALIGTWIGIKLHHRVPERLFFMLTYIMLTITGAKLIWDGLT